MKDIVVIIPVHKMDEKTPELLKRAIKSVPEEIEIRISCANGLSDEIKKELGENPNITYHEMNDKETTDFQSLVNNAVGDSKWFSILEFDDEYTPIWFDNVKRYIDSYGDISVMLPLEDLFDFNTNEYLGYGNDAPWAAAFSDELGYVDMDSLKTYFDFYLTGGVFKTDDWKELGGLKKSMKITFWYEFMLRCIHYGKKIFIIPKVGYNHYLGREDSLIEIYRNTVDEKEGEGYFNLARQEYFFKEDRNKTWKKDNE